jgi:hypothetical protein
VSKNANFVPVHNCKSSIEKNRALCSIYTCPSFISFRGTNGPDLLYYVRQELIQRSAFIPHAWILTWIYFNFSASCGQDKPYVIFLSNTLIKCYCHLHCNAWITSTKRERGACHCDLFQSSTLNGTFSPIARVSPEIYRRRRAASFFRHRTTPLSYQAGTFRKKKSYQAGTTESTYPGRAITQAQLSGQQSPCSPPLTAAAA